MYLNVLDAHECIEMMSGPWNVEETNALLDVWGADSVQSQLDGICKNKMIYQQVVIMMSDWGMSVLGNNARQK